MPTALDRLLASPSTLKALRAVVNATEFPALWAPSINCCRPRVPHRECSSQSGSPNLRIWRYRSYKDAGEDTSKLSSVDSNDTGHNSSIWLEISKSSEGPERDKLLATALLYKERTRRLSGIREVWLAIARRGYRLPTAHTSAAEIIWTTLLKHPDLVVPILDHATYIKQETGELFPLLYEMCMTYWLPRNPELALQLHHRMIVKLQLRKLPLCRMAEFIGSNTSAASLEAFLEIYRTSDERDVYDKIVPILCDLQNLTMARRWHTMCVHRKDLPSASVATHPLIQFFLAESALSTEDMARDSKAPARGVARSTTQSKHNQELMRQLLGRDSAPVRFEDSFCARLFATKAFPPESIIKGLTMVGVNEIGPQALRAMALRTEPLSDMQHRFKELREAGIALKGCVFSVALQKFTGEGRWMLAQSMLDSDQHPDVFGDSEIQKKLLDQYLEHGDWTQAHRTLAILALFHNDVASEAWNQLLQARVRHFEPQQIVQILHDMRAKGLMLSIESLLAIGSILRRRRGGRLPEHSGHAGFDDLRFVARAYMTILESGIGFIPPHAWREVIRRYGILGRIKELRRLVLWLLSWYAPPQGAKFLALPRPMQLEAATSKMQCTFPGLPQYFNLPPTLSQRNPMHPVRQLFPPSFQQGLIVWGFRAGLLPTAPLEQSMLGLTASKKSYRKRFLSRGILKRPHWSIGLEHLVELRDLGLAVHPHTVLKTLQMQFVVLFGRGRSRVRANRIMEEVNTMSYEEYVSEVNRIWGGRLFLEAGPSGRSRLHDLMWHPRRQRVAHRKSSVNLDEVIGRGWRRAHLTSQDRISDDKLATRNARRKAQTQVFGDVHHIAHSWQEEPEFAFLAEEKGPRVE